MHSQEPASALALIDALIAEAFEQVAANLSGAMAAFVTGDRDAARRVTAADSVMDELASRIEDAAVDALTQASDLLVDDIHGLLIALRIAPELERSNDLASHVAALGAQGLAAWLTDRGRDLAGQMGSLGVGMWRLAADAYQARDAAAADSLRALDDEIDDLHVSLTAELAAADVSVPVAIQMALAARYLERLGDHAVNVTARLRARSSQPA